MPKTAVKTTLDILMHINLLFTSNCSMFVSLSDGKGHIFCGPSLVLDYNLKA